MARAVAVIALIATIALPSTPFWAVLGNDMLQAQQLVDHRQEHCIVPDSRVHAVYRSMLASLRQELAQWEEFKVWSEAELPTMSLSIDLHRQESAARLHELETAPICARAS